MTKLFISTRRIIRESERLPLRRRRSAHLTLVLAWVAFWLNTAFIPCCEAFAATSDDHAGAEVHAISTPEQTHDGHDSPVEAPHHAPDSPCDTSFHGGPATNGEQAGLPTERVDLEWDATYLLFTNHHFAKNKTANFAPVDYQPSPRRPRLYLQTQRLLI